MRQKMYQPGARVPLNLSMKECMVWHGHFDIVDGGSWVSCYDMHIRKESSVDCAFYSFLKIIVSTVIKMNTVEIDAANRPQI